jgi:hypothetical protein
MAVRFDATTLRVIGEPVEVLRDIRRENLMQDLQLATGASGSVAFARGVNADVGRFVWADREGATPVHPSLSSKIYGSFFLSTDGRRVAAKVFPDTGLPEIWFLDTATGDQRKWVDEGIVAGREVRPGPWIPGTNTIMAHVRGDTNDILEIDAERASGAKRVWAGSGYFIVDGIMKDGRLLLDVGVGPVSVIHRNELTKLPSDVRPALKPVVARTGQQGLSGLSPDGKWLAYTSDESGPYEVWATRLPPQGEPIKISNGGGELPRWSPRSDGFYYRFGQRWYWVALTGSDDRPFREPELYLEGDYLNVAGPEHEVHPDGKRLLLLQGSGERTTTTLDFIVNWRAELERRLPDVRQ